MVEGLQQLAPLLLRALGLVAILPFGDGLMLVTRSAMAFGLSLLCIDVVPPTSTGLDPAAVLLQFGVGIALGLPAAIVTECLAIAGELIDNGRGQNQANVYEPLHNQTVSYLALFGKHFTWYVLLALGVLPALVGNFVRSFAVIPVTAGFTTMAPISMEALLFLTEALGSTFLLILPFATLFLLIEIAAGFVSKGSSRSGLSGEVFLVKSTLAFLLLLAIQQFDLSVGLSVVAESPLPTVVTGAPHG